MIEPVQQPEDAQGKDAPAKVPPATMQLALVSRTHPPLVMQQPPGCGQTPAPQAVPVEV